MNTAACAGQWELFDSTDRADHEMAAEMCETCPLRRTCDEDALRLRATLPLEGTWAGRLYNSGTPAEQLLIRCGRCGDEFKRTRHRFRYCSEACSEAARRENHARYQARRAARLGQSAARRRVAA